MTWSVVLTDEAKAEIRKLSPDLRARFAAVSDLLLENGPMSVGMPYVRPIESKLWEMRLKGKDGIARAIYFAASGRRIVVLTAFVKKTETTPRRIIDVALRRMRMFDV
ncbi:type II toxin-antitoxin system RelE/ParE family toxin [Aurantimonas sp. C2-6-R+9]|uniref:type II toxin-antitoxin system RelE/ParE family toxin n=1 Tax=unclassified Aurantimonas TaxID=2638230 RepID=UPI002E19098A|nr:MULTISPECIES: type II toxin-antitoxin system RelE/ParE family toxin [unclassified Aurantimonas]MEC5291671.1 type II toxin-antitoxin system RelE/ParE family toxin [Aurantimonas sp. C2-3-R2]MEC5381853.1 type II toxin-antitoxin system RelE/ParE family toxin [Aurantimonas sp. C2-6-R+9]MEC5412755.1 type II toxin-antitoxin system RelE/ParE family toxin [Aurantimonas sp. C2-4-R8]